MAKGKTPIPGKFLQYNKKEKKTEFQPLDPSSKPNPNPNPNPSNNTSTVNAKSKKKTGSRLWMRFDRTGHWELLECDKSAILKRVSIPARDLRILGPVFSHSSNIIGDLGVKSDGKGNVQRVNTPRSKHSATEQRRRSKINDRFQILRDLIPNSSDQKRDKASFLLEVIEYIQFLQEKVHKYETAFPGWNQDSMKLTTWKHSQGSGGNTADLSRVIKNGPGAGLMFDDNSIDVAPAMLSNAQNLVESDSLMNTGLPYKPIDHQLGLTSKAAPLPMTLQQNMYTSVGRSGGLVQPPQRLMSDAENMPSQPQPQLWPRSYPVDSDMLNEQEELTIEGGTIRMSSIYSQGVLSSLTQALQNSGIDLSQASISVQIDIGKRAIGRPSMSTSSAKDLEDPSSSNRPMTHGRVVSSGEDSDQAQKRLKMDNGL